MDTERAFELLGEGARANPGPWVGRSLDAAYAARVIAEAAGLDADLAYRAALLADIGYSGGPCGLAHALRGHDALAAAGFPEGARACLVHSFPSGRVDDWPGARDDDVEALQSRLDALGPFWGGGQGPGGNAPREVGLDDVIQLAAVLADREIAVALAGNDRALEALVAKKAALERAIGFPLPELFRPRGACDP